MQYIENVEELEKFYEALPKFDEIESAAARQYNATNGTGLGFNLFKWNDRLDVHLNNVDKARNDARKRNAAEEVEISPFVAKYLFDQYNARLIKPMSEQSAMASSILFEYGMSLEDQKYLLKLGEVKVRDTGRASSSRFSAGSVSESRFMSKTGISPHITSDSFSTPVEKQQTEQPHNLNNESEVVKPHFRHLEGKWVQQEIGRGGNEDSGLSK